jgi:excisionase family DNA binding protein
MIISFILFITFISFTVYIKPGTCNGEPGGNTAMATATLDPITLPQAEEEQVHRLSEFLHSHGQTLLIGHGGDSPVEIPETVHELLVQILDLMRQGKAISIIPVTQDLTTQQAAEVIGVSRPFFVKLIEAGALPFHLAGTHRRVYLRDLLAYKERRDRARHAAIERMADQAEKDGIYDTVLLPEA